MNDKNLKLKLTDLDMSNIRSSGVTNSTSYFAFASTPYKNQIKALINLTFCRETICEYVRQELRGIKNCGINYNKLYLVAYRRMAVGQLSNNIKIYKEQILAAQHALNTIEKHYGWPLTRVMPTTIINEGSFKIDPVAVESLAAYYIIASRRWLKSPAMLSLFILIFRIAGRVGKKFEFVKRIKNIETLFSVLNDAANKSSYQEVAYYRQHGQRWKLVLDNYNKLFGCRDMTDLYYPKSSGWFFTEGINSLCDDNSNDSILKKQFRELVAKAGV